MARRIASALAVLAGLALVACETEPASQTGYFDATVHAKVGCVDTRGNDSGYDAQWRIAYRLVGASGAWTADAWHDYTCPDEQTPHYLAGSPFSEMLTGLRQNREYEYRLEVQHVSGAPGTFEWRDSAGTKNGTDYDRFTTDAFPTVGVSAAKAFRDSQGVNTRTGWRTDPIWGNYPKNREALAHTGIRRIRDGLYPDWNTQQWAFLRDVATNLGVKAQFGLGEMDPQNDDTCGPFDTAAQIANVRADATIRGMVEAIEGQNEVDHLRHGERITGWVECLRLKTPDNYAKVGGEWPVVGPTLVCMSVTSDCPHGNAFDLVGDLSSWLDYGNMHPYPGGDPPEKEALDVHIPQARKLSGSKPMQVTETGYYTDLATATYAVSEQVQATYTLRLLLEHFRRGIWRTYLYSIVDPSCTDRYHYGLYRCDWTKKPVADALHNMNAAVGDGSPALTPLPWRVDQAPSDYRQVVLRRSDGAYVVAVWRTASVWDRGTETPIDVPPKAFIAKVPDAQSVHWVRPLVSATENAAPFSNGELTFVLGGEPILFVIR